MTEQPGITPHSREEAGDRRCTDDQDHVVDREEKLDEGLKDSMDASDPPSTTQPGDHGDPVPSSGFPEGEADSAGKGGAGRDGAGRDGQ